MTSPRQILEYRRRALVETQRQTMRIVKRTLLGIALFGAAYYFGLVMKEKKNTAPSKTRSTTQSSTAETQREN